MKRELKFRAWDIQHGAFVGIESFSFRSNREAKTIELEWVNTEAEESLIPNTHCIIEQSTGLKDRFGIEIFEGDLIKCHKDFGSPVAEVVYILGHGCWGLLHDSFKRTVTQYKRLTQKTLNESLGEIVGNIHANPNLLQ